MGNGPKRKPKKDTSVSKRMMDLMEMNAGLQKGLFNLRQMYDQSVMEREAMRANLVQRDQLIVAMADSYGQITIEEDELASVAQGRVIGYNIERDEDDGTLSITPVYPEPEEEEVDDGDDA